MPEDKFTIGVTTKSGKKTSFHYSSEAKLLADWEFLQDNYKDISVFKDVPIDKDNNTLDPDTKYNVHADYNGKPVTYSMSGRNINVGNREWLDTTFGKDGWYIQPEYRPMNPRMNAEGAVEGFDELREPEEKSYTEKWDEKNGEEYRELEGRMNTPEYKAMAGKTQMDAWQPDTTGISKQSPTGENGATPADTARIWSDIRKFNEMDAERRRQEQLDEYKIIANEDSPEAKEYADWMESNGKRMEELKDVIAKAEAVGSMDFNPYLYESAMAQAELEGLKREQDALRRKVVDSRSFQAKLALQKEELKDMEERVAKVGDVIEEEYVTHGAGPNVHQVRTSSYRGGKVPDNYSKLASTASRNIDIAVGFNEDTERTLNANSNSFWAGAGTVAFNPNTYAMNIPESLDKIMLKGIVDKMMKNGYESLTEDEQTAIEAWQRNAEAHALLDPMRSNWFKGGQGAAQSVEFMAEMAISGSIIDAASKGLFEAVLKRGMKKELIKGAEELAGKTLMEGLSKLATNNLEREGSKFLVENLVKFGVGLPKGAVQTVLTPTMFLRTLGDQLLTFDENGNLPTWGDALKSSAFDSLVEVWSENGVEPIWNIITHYPMKLGGLAAKSVMPGAYRNMERFLTKMNASSFGKAMRAGGFQGMGEEMFEELMGAVVRAAAGDKDELADFFTKDNLATLAISFAPMTLVGGGMSAVQVGYADGQYKRNRLAIENLMRERGYTANQISYYLDSILSDPAEGHTELYASILEQAYLDNAVKASSTKKGKDGKPSIELTGEWGRLENALLQFRASAARKSAYDGAWESRQNEQRESEGWKVLNEYGMDISLEGGLTADDALEGETQTEGTDTDETPTDGGDDGAVFSAEEIGRKPSKHERMRDHIDKNHVVVVSTTDRKGNRKQWFIVSQRTESGEYMAVPTDPREARKLGGKPTLISENDIVRGQKRDGGKVRKMTVEETIAASTQSFKDFLTNRLLYNRRQQDKAITAQWKQEVRTQRSKIIQEIMKLFYKDGRYVGTFGPDGEYRIADSQPDTSNGLRVIKPGEEEPTPMTWDEIYNILSGGEDTMPTEQDVDRAMEQREEKEGQTEEKQPQSALAKIPKDGKGNPMFESAESPTLAWEALVESQKGNAQMAEKIVNAALTQAKKAAAKAKAEADKAKAKADDAENNPKGNTLGEMVAYKEKADEEARTAAKEAETANKRVGFYQSMADEAKKSTVPTAQETQQSQQEKTETSQTENKESKRETPQEKPSETPQKKPSEAPQVDESQKRDTEERTGRFGRIHIKGGLIARVAEKLMKKLSPEQVKRLHLENFVRKDGLYLSISGVYYKDGYAYATDNRILIKVKTDYPTEWEGKIIDPKGKVVEGKYPDVDKALNGLTSAEDWVGINPQELLDSLKAVAEAKKGKFVSIAAVALETTQKAHPAAGEKTYKTLLLNAEYAKQLESVVKSCDNVEVYTSGDTITIIADGAVYVSKSISTLNTSTNTWAVAYKGQVYIGEAAADSMRREADRLRREAENLLGTPKEKALKEAERLEGLLGNAKDMKEFNDENHIDEAETQKETAEEKRQREFKEMNDAIRAELERLNIQGQVITSEEELRVIAQKLGKGFAKDIDDKLRRGTAINAFVKDGKVYVYSPDIFDRYDGEERARKVRQTIAHEVVAHIGLKNMKNAESKDGFISFCKDVYDKLMTTRDRETFLAYQWNINMTEAKRKYMLDKAGIKTEKGGKARWSDLTEEQRERLLSSDQGKSVITGAADEYIARIAEKMESGEALSNEERTAWQRFIDWLRRKFGVEMTEHDVVDALLEAKRGMENTQTENDASKGKSKPLSEARIGFATTTTHRGYNRNKETINGGGDIDGFVSDTRSFFDRMNTKVGEAYYCLLRGDSGYILNIHVPKNGRGGDNISAFIHIPYGENVSADELKAFVESVTEKMLNGTYGDDLTRQVRNEGAIKESSEKGDERKEYEGKELHERLDELKRTAKTADRSGLDGLIGEITGENTESRQETQTENKETAPSSTEVKKVNVEGVFNDLYSKGKTTLSDHAEEVRTEKPAPEGKGQNEGQFGIVSDERMEELKNRLRAKLNGQLNFGFDPEVLAIGLELTAGYIDRGIRSFTDFAKRMLNDLGEVVRPYLKAFYNGARDLPQIVESGLDKQMTPYDEVNATDMDALMKELEENTETGAENRADSGKKSVSSQDEERADEPSGQKEKKEKEPYNGHNGIQQTDTADVSGSGDGGGQQGGLQEGGEGGKGEAQQGGGRASDGQRVRGGSGNDGPVSSGLSSGLKKNSRNNHSERGADHAPKSVNARIEANIAAIELAQKLTESGEQATPEQMEVLRRFSGWGGLGKAFEDRAYDNPHIKRLKELLGEDGYQEAVMSANSGYYTPAAVIDTLWDIAQRLGFKGGRILEGSAGIGNIIGQMPSHISGNSDIHAVEIDRTTGMILSLLYPDAKVDVQGFESTRIPNGSVDLAITNVPFVTGLRVDDTSGDKDLSKKFHNIHDFCIAKNVRKLRPGGIGIFITSNGTLDNSKSLRDWIVGDGNSDVIGAFRLNNTTFGGTSVTSDIIVIRKRIGNRKSADAIDVSAVSEERKAEYTETTSKGKENTRTLSLVYNKYFIDHPEMMAGRMMFGFENGETYRPESKGLYPAQGMEQSRMLEEFVNSFHEQEQNQEQGQTDTRDETRTTGGPEGHRVGEMFIKDGRLVIADAEGHTPLNVNSQKVRGHTKEECFKAYSAIKDALAEVLDYQSRNTDDEGLTPLLNRLNNAFDRFVKTYGHFSKNTAISFLRKDIDFPNIAVLETRETKVDYATGEKTEVYTKSDVMNKRVVENTATPTPENVTDGVVASVFKFGRIDIPYIAESLGMGEEEVKAEIISSGLGFEDPSTMLVVPAFQYLSGNVREKLRQAEANNENGAYDANIRELRKVIPMNIPAHLIEFNIGSSWIEPSLYAEYVKARTDIDVEFSLNGGVWNMKTVTTQWRVESGEKNKAMGVRSERFGKWILGTVLIEAAIQNRTVEVKETHKSRYTGEKETIHDKEATLACTNKIDEIKQDFRDWMRERMKADPDLSARMETKYNDEFNNYVWMEIPDTFVPEWFPGASHKDKMRRHQGKAIVRGTMQSLFLAHEVGTGKTYTLISTAMEMRRLGLARKPMIVVQNSTVGQFVSSAKSLYPNAKILTLEEADKTPEGRMAFYAKVRYNDWDMIVIPQSAFEMIPDSEDRQRTYIQDKIDEKMHVLEQIRAASRDEKSTVLRQAEKELASLQNELASVGTEKDRLTATQKKRKAVDRQNAEVRAKEMLDRKTDEVRNFDEMGVDALFVDEAHEYKHLGFSTAMQRGVKGVDPSFSKKAQGLYLKVKAVQEMNNGRNVVFATGTPVSNTAAEVWTFLRYLMDADTMKEYGIYYFDDFVRNFGNIQRMPEFATNGTFKENNRFAGYVNLPELMRIWLGVADTVLTKEAEGVQDKIPKMETGAAQDIYLPQTQSLRAVMKAVRKELEKYEKMTGAEKKQNSHIPLVQYGIAKAAAVDTRLVMTNAPDEKDSKTNRAVAETLRSLKDTESYRGTVAIFADTYQNKKTGFNLYEDIKSKLIAAGVPAEEIVIMRSGMSVKQKEDIFDKVNNGEIRVILGSTFTLGTGVNIQERLHTLIHLDAPNRPMDYTQRNGRMLRQGNHHKEWDIPVRVLRFGVEDSLDVTAYQRLKTKGAIADSIMKGKELIRDSMSNRIIEEEEDVFGNTVAQLSGSEYALLMNGAERNVRKYESRRKQWESDQTYIHHHKPELQGRLGRTEETVNEARESLERVREAFPDGKAGTITADGQRFGSVEEMKDFLTAHNKMTSDKLQSMKRNSNEPGMTSTVTLSVGGYTFRIRTEVNRQAVMMNEGGLMMVAHRKMTYSCRELGLEDMEVKGGLLRVAVEDIVNNVVTGKVFQDRIDSGEQRATRLREEIGQLESREGKPFEFEKELADAREKYREYAELMKKEMEEKERKYAEMDKEIEEADDLSYTEEEDEGDEGEQQFSVDEDEEDEEEFPTDDNDTGHSDEESETRELSDSDTRFSVTPKDQIPKKKGYGYKAFLLIKGKLYPPQVLRNIATPVGMWITAEESPIVGKSKQGWSQTKGKSGALAFRPGWHLGRLPYAFQFNVNDPETGKGASQKDGLVPARLVWALCEFDMDTDYSEEARANGYKNADGSPRESFDREHACLTYMPENGYYEYRTNPNPLTDNWIITDKMRVTKILTDEEVDDIIQKAYYDENGNDIPDKDGIPLRISHPLQRREARKNQEQRDGWIEELNRQISEVEAEEAADRRETVSDIENPEGDTSFSATERVATADEARERFGVDLTPDDLASTSTKHGAMMRALRKATENGDIPGMDTDDLITFLADTYRTAPNEVKSSIWETFSESANPDIAREVEYALAEYVSREVRGAELTDAQREFLDNAAKTIADRLGITEDNAKYVLWQHSNANDELVTNAERAAMQNALGVTTPASDYEAEVQSEARFSAAEEEMIDSARDYYEKGLMSISGALGEVVHNEYRALDKLVEAIVKQTGREVMGWDPRHAYNQLTSNIKARLDAYMRDYYSPLVKEIVSICKDRNISINDLREYVSLKHGLERNRVFHERAVAQAAEDGRKTPEKRDYSGITAWMEDYGEFETIEEAEAKAQEIVDNYDRTLGERATSLWKAINRATNETLLMQLRNGLMSAEQYDEIRSMFKYYIPLQGFEKATNEDKYVYFGAFYDGRTGTIGKKAMGRKSKASDPFGRIGINGQKSVIETEKNRAKCSLYEFLYSHADNDLTTLGSVWYIKTNRKSGDKDVWEVATPTFAKDETPQQMAETISRWEETMRGLAEKGEAVMEKNRFSLGSDVVFTYPGDVSQHCVDVFVDGQRKRMYIKGNPRAAQAVNGLLTGKNPDIARMIKKSTRYLSNIYTSANPQFFVTNFARDVGFSIFNIGSKEGAGYLVRFIGNAVRAAQIGTFSRRFRNGNLDTDKEMQWLYREFAMNGGITGYSQVRDDKYYEKQVTKALKGNRWMIKALTAIPEAFRHITEDGENLLRFATFVTSFKSGRSTTESVADAKDATVNFNRRGTARMISEDEAERLIPGDGTRQRVARFALRGVSAIMSFAPAYSFFNVAIQGMAQVLQNFKDHTARATTFVLGYFGLGLLNTMIHGAAETLTGGDPPEADDWYWNIPDWERRNNIIIPLGGGRYIKIPMAQELRVYYGLGEMIGGMMAHKTAQKNIPAEFLGSFGEMLPVNPFGEGGLGQSVMPTTLSPIFDVALNKDYRGMSIVPERHGGTNAKWRYSYGTTPDWAIAASRTLNGILPILDQTKPDVWDKVKHPGKLKGSDLFDWNRGDSGSLDVSPEAIQHYAEGYLGGILTFVSMTYETGKSIAKGEDINMRRVPYVNRFYGRSDDRQAGSYILEMNRYAKRIYNRAKSKEKWNIETHGVQEEADFAKTKEYRIYVLYHGFKDGIRDLNERIANAPDERNKMMLIERRNRELTVLATQMEHILYDNNNEE